MEILSIENENGQFLGLAITIQHNDIVLLDYFAIEENMRGMGMGSQALTSLFARYPGKRVMLEIERSDIPCDNQEQRTRRKAFYLRCGMAPMPYLVNLFGVEMEILTKDCRVDYDEYHSIFCHVFSPTLAKNVQKCNT